MQSEAKRKYREKNKDKINAKNREYYYRTIEYQKEKSKKWNQNNPEKSCEKSKRWNRNNPEKAMFTRTKARAKMRGIEFTISREDIIIPSHCPVFHIPLVVSEGRMQENSPSLDRIDSSKGYIPGNVIVVSLRANHLKGDGTPDELIRIGTFFKSYGYDV